MIVAITGGTGFIGRRLAARHQVQGDEVRVLSRRPAGSPGLPRSVIWYAGDLAGPADLRSFVDGVDVLYHCAGEVVDESRMGQVHIEGTQRLIREAAGRIGRWVQLSSVGAYGTQRAGTVTEQTGLDPCGTYEVTKAASDALVAAAAQGGAFEHAILRPSNVYGTDMSNRSLFALIEMIRRGWFFFIGEAGAAANYIHVDNVVEALLLCGTRPEASSQVYNLSDHRVMERFVATIAAALGRPVPHLRLPDWPVRLSARLLGRLPGFPLTEARVDALTGRAVYSTAKIERELGYRHRVSMEQGLEELVRSRPGAITR